MNLEYGHIYHIYNQGNNKQKIFFQRENYLFFLKKINEHITPFGDVVAWCLMPNHFHLMVYITHQTATHQTATHQMAPSHLMSDQPINNSIAVMLRSYTRAINIQENRSGSLFKPRTKAECVTKSQGITPSFINSNQGAIIHVPIPEKEYPQVCFHYIHNNPVKANLVNKPEDWEFSSFRDYCGLRNGKLIKRERAKEFGLTIVHFDSSDDLESSDE